MALICVFCVIRVESFTSLHALYVYSTQAKMSFLFGVKGIKVGREVLPRISTPERRQNMS